MENGTFRFYILTRSTMSHSLPDRFIKRLQNIVPTTQLDVILNSFKQKKSCSFRINPLKISEAEFIPMAQKLGLSLTRLPQLPYAFTVPVQQKSLLSHSKLVTEGLCYIQGVSSMLPVLQLAPSAEQRVLDLAAAPGSKTTQLAIAMQNQGWISAVEINKSRFFKLKSNLTSQGISNVHTYLMDGSQVWKKCPEMFDKVLLDAPCSSEARFLASEPASYAYWSEKKIREMAKKQKRLIFSAFLSLKPGGELMYSTCSFAPEENEQIVNYLLKKFAGKVEIEPLVMPFDNTQQGITEWQGKKLNDTLHQAVRILPNDLMEGFFICKLRKTGSTRIL